MRRTCAQRVVGARITGAFCAVISTGSGFTHGTLCENLEGFTRFVNKFLVHFYTVFLGISTPVLRWFSSLSTPLINTTAWLKKDNLLIEAWGEYR